jgi:tetratricopeptide (TPR) repeat protein
MYLRTPKRYQRNKRRGMRIRWRWLPLWIIAPIIIFIGVGIYENREMIPPDYVDKLFNDLIGEANDQISGESTPVPTASPDLTDDLLVAATAWERGAIDDAVVEYAKIAEQLPNDQLVYYRLTLGLIMQAKMDEALIVSENGITSQPFAPDAWSIHSMVLNRLDRPTEAIASSLRALELIEMFEDVPGISVSHARALAFLAEAYLDDEQAERALTLVNDALEINPNGFEAYVVRGRIYSESYYDFDTALEDFQMAYDLAPNMIYVTIRLARLERYFYEDYEMAVGLYQEIIDLNPGNTLALYDLADYYFRTEGNLGAATQYLEKCIIEAPDNARCHYLLGRTKMRQEDVIGAQAAFEVAYALDPDDGYVNYWIAQTLSCQQAKPYLQNGYTIALNNQDTDLMDAFQFELQNCGEVVSSPSDG